MPLRSAASIPVLATAVLYLTTEAPAQVYVDQPNIGVSPQVYVDQFPTVRTDHVYVDQLPPSARLRSGGTRAASKPARASQSRQFILGRPADPATQEPGTDNIAQSVRRPGEEEVTEEEARRRAAQARPRFPSTYTGTRAIINAEIPAELPTVGAGTIRR